MYQKQYNLEGHHFSFRRDGESTLDQVLGLIVDERIADLAYWMEKVNQQHPNFLLAQTGNDYGKHNTDYPYHYSDFFPDMLQIAISWGRIQVLDFLLFDEVNQKKELMRNPDMGHNALVLYDINMNISNVEQCLTQCLLHGIYWDIADCQHIPSRVWQDVFLVIKDDEEKLKDLRQGFFWSIDINDLNNLPHKEDVLKTHNPSLFYQYERLNDLINRFEMKRMFDRGVGHSLKKNKI